MRKFFAHFRGKKERQRQTGKKKKKNETANLQEKRFCHRLQVFLFFLQAKRLHILFFWGFLSASDTAGKRPKKRPGLNIFLVIRVVVLRK